MMLSLVVVVLCCSDSCLIRSYFGDRFVCLLGGVHRRGVESTTRIWFCRYAFVFICLSWLLLEQLLPTCMWALNCYDLFLRLFLLE